MTPGPLQPFRRRTLRGLAGFVVTFLLAGHALAATGLCAVPTPQPPPALQDAVVLCEEHTATGVDRAPAVKHHCPAEEPTPQGRSVDLPAPQQAAVVASVAFLVVDAGATRLAPALFATDVPPPPLYARLQRLRL
jgi:hypothetical protein